MNPLLLPELFYQMTTNLNGKEKIFLISGSKIMYNFKSLLILDSEYNIEKIDNKLRTKNIFIKDFSLENKIKELIKDLIPESIVANSKYIKIISNNANIKLFHNKEILKIMDGDEYVNIIDEQFLKASRYGHLSVTELLIKSGANVHARNNRAIINASYWGHLSIVKLLIESGANVNAQNNEALILASWKGNLSIIELLIKSGDNIHARDNQAIINASWNGHLSTVKFLIKSGANIHAQNNQAIIEASSHGHISVFPMIRLCRISRKQKK